MASSASSKTEEKLGEPPVLEEMGRNTVDDGTLRRTWFTPERLLVIFCAINMLNYVDRGAMASNGVNGSRRSCTSSGICSSDSGIQGDFNLNNFEDGVLSSAFMVGLLVASPIFASLAKTHNPFRLIGVGLSVWTFATACCGASFSFWSIAIFRMLVGVGEASFISLAAPYIDDNAPVSSRTAWLAIFYMCIPAGVALGYVYGGLVGSHLHWRWAFWGESILMFPFAVFGFVVKPLQLKGFRSLDHPEESDAASSVVADGGHESSEETTATAGLRNQVLSFFKDLKVLLTDPVYVVNVLGYVAYNFVIGAYSYWGPKAGYNIYRMSDADLTFGGITILCGVLGTLAGGYTLDRISATISNAFKLLAAASFFGAALCFSAFCLKNMYGFIALFAVGELFVFGTQAPVNYVCLHCVSPSLRPLSMAVSTVAIHVFGDVPSSPLVGILQDRINNWRESALILTSILFLAALIWSVGAFLNGVDKVSNEDTGNGSCCTLRAKMAPLLEESSAVDVHESHSPG